MDVSLSQLIQLKKRLSVEINTTKNEFLRGSYTEKTADELTDEVTPEEFEESHNKMLKLHQLHLAVSLLVTKLNTQIVVEEGSMKMPIQQAIIHAEFLRDYGRACKQLGAQKAKVIGSNGNIMRSGEKVVVDRHYDIKGMLTESKALMLQGDRLSRAIERASVITTIALADHPELEGVEEYL